VAIVLIWRLVRSPFGRVLLATRENERRANCVGYDPKRYELLARIYAAGWTETFEKFDPIPNHKTDTNNHGPMSTDNIGANYDYPNASYEQRRAIIEEHKNYQQGWLYFIANDPRVPADVRTAMSRCRQASSPRITQ